MDNDCMYTILSCIWLICVIVCTSSVGFILYPLTMYIWYCRLRYDQDYCIYYYNDLYKEINFLPFHILFIPISYLIAWMIYPEIEEFLIYNCNKLNNIDF